MKSVPTAVRRAAVVVALLITMIVPAAYGDEPFEAPQARINPPGGSPSQAEPDSIAFFASWLWLQVRFALTTG